MLQRRWAPPRSPDGEATCLVPTDSNLAPRGGRAREIALLANNFDVKWVMDQVGHADSTMTMDVYAQLQQRADRSHGTSFDRLVRKARGQLAGLPTAA